MDVIGRPAGMGDQEWDALGASLYHACEEAYDNYMKSEGGYKARFADRTFDFWLEKLTLYLLQSDAERGNDNTFDEVQNEAWGHVRERYNRKMTGLFDDANS